MKVLVTGSSGAIGAAIVERLREEHEVVGLDLQPGTYTSALGDIAEERFVDGIVERMDAVIHAASLHAPHVTSHTEEAFLKTNVRGTQVLLAAAERHGLRRFVYTSTTSVYGNAMECAKAAVWVTENLPPRPRDIYDRTKLAAEALCKETAARGVVSCVALRMSRCFPEPPELMAIYRLYRGVDKRDVAEAHALALTSDVGPFSVFNISSQSPFLPEDLEELLADASVVLRRRCPEVLREFERRHWSLPRSIDRVYAIGSALKDLHYQPKFGFREYVTGS